MLFGVVPVVYEFEGTSLEFLLNQLDTCLHGRTARCTHTHTRTSESRLCMYARSDAVREGSRIWGRRVCYGSVGRKSTSRSRGIASVGDLEFGKVEVCQGVLGIEVPYWGPRAKLQYRRFWGTSPTEAGDIMQIILQ